MNVLIEKQPSYPLSTKIQAGGNRKDGAYLVYSGSIEDVRNILNAILAATEDYKERPLYEKVMLYRP